MHPRMEPRVPSVNGIVIPKIVLFIVVVALYDVCVDDVCVDDADDVDADEDSRANTSDAGINMLQHQSYK